MPRIALIGCGNIGTRLLQSLVTAGIEDPIELICIDPAEEQRALARTRIEEACNGEIPPGLSLHFAAELAHSEPALDLAIIATTSRPRFRIVQDLLASMPPRTLLLEKFLFTEYAAYETISDMLSQTGSRAFVHTPRPAWPGYLELERRLSEATTIEMRVSGANWAMASNAIHFVAALMKLSGETDITFDASRLNNVPIDNKRAGYKEVSGTLVASTPSRKRLEMTCLTEGKAQPVVTLTSDKGQYVIFEGAQKMHAQDETTDWAWQEQPFEILFASQMQRPLRSLLAGGHGDLPSYGQMTGPHKDLMGVFNRVFFGAGHERDDCPVT